MTPLFVGSPPLPLYPPFQLNQKYTNEYTTLQTYDHRHTDKHMDAQTNKTIAPHTLDVYLI